MKIYATSSSAWGAAERATKAHASALGRTYFELVNADVREVWSAPGELAGYGVTEACYNYYDSTMSTGFRRDWCHVDPAPWAVELES